MRVKLKNKKGFTLIEVTITVAILGMIVVLLGDMYVDGTISAEKEMRKSKLQVEAKNVLEGIDNNVKLSAKVDASYTTGSNAVYTGSATTLILDIPAIDSSNNFIYSGSQNIYDHIIYYLDPANTNNLHKLVFSDDPSSRLYSQNGSDQIILNDVQSLAFTYDASPPSSAIVDTNLTLYNTGQGNTQTVNVSAEAKRRNSE